MTDCCAPGRGPAEAPRAAVATGSGQGDPGDLLRLSAGVFAMGDDGPLAQPRDGEGPVRDVTVASFEIAPTTVTNERFAAFTAATGHVTDAERFGWSFVFAGQVTDPVRGRAGGADWWCGVDGADWQHPTGPSSEALPDHPVVHVSWDDAVAYCHWVGVRLPDEQEWEYAARGGLHRATYPWGDELRPDGQWRLNIWQGAFPEHDTGEDGWIGTAPVDAYSPNGYGLHQVVGNVWEWTASSWEPGSAAYVRRGGSYLCHASYCHRYRVSARDRSLPTDTTGHTGFRIAR